MPRKSRAKNVARKIASSIDGIVESGFQEVYDAVKSEYEPMKRQLDSYRKKAQAADIAIKYINERRLKVSRTDRKKVGPAYAKKLEQAVALNRRYKDAVERAAKVSELEKEKAGFEAKLNQQKESYEKRIRELGNKYKEAEFVKNRWEELRVMPLREYETAMETEDSLRQLEESTYYNGKPTSVTGALHDVVALIKTRNGMREKTAKYVVDIKVLLGNK